MVLILARSAAAATFPVANLADSGAGSLRQAVLGANASPGADEVVFAAGLTGTITLTSGEILISDSLLVTGPGAGVLTVSGNDHSRIFRVEKAAVTAPIDVTLSGLTLTRGYAPFAGGAVFGESENLTLRNCVISDSVSGLAQDPPIDGCGGNVGFSGMDGGTLRIADSTLTGGDTDGIGSSYGGNLCVFRGSFLLERSTLSGGTSHTGGGLFVDSLTGDSTIVHSTITGNRSQGAGGGIASEFQGGALTIDSSTISGNTAGSSLLSFGFGGGISWGQGPLRIVNSTISGNSATRGGGGIQVAAFGLSSLHLRLTTISNNTAGDREGGSILVSQPQAAIQLDHAILANGAPQDLASEGVFLPAFTANYSLIEAPGDAVFTGANNLIGADPLLGPLAGNGGSTLSHRPLPGSPVLDAGNPAIPNPPATDQRGAARIAGTAVDLGSVEGQRGATFTVANLADSGAGSLRQAVLGANASPGADEVVFAPGLTGTITLTSGAILISDSLLVTGPGAGVLTVSGNDVSRVFLVEKSTVATPIDVTLSGLTLTRGYSPFPGGAVFGESENLTIRNSVISDSLSGLQQDPVIDGCGGNVGFSGMNGGTLRIADSTLSGGRTIGAGSSYGGNLCVFLGSFLLERSTLSGGTADTGGGLFVDALTGDSTIVRSTFTGNLSHGVGGGIASLFQGAATLTIDSSTLSGNTAGRGPLSFGFGGGISWGQGNLRIVNSTISGNTATQGGGGVHMSEIGGGSLHLRLTTVSNNTAGDREGGSILVSQPQAAIQLDHAILANGAPQDLASEGAFLPAFTANYSLIEAPGDAVFTGANNLIGVDPLLGLLASNGGPTLSHRPLLGSPVLDAGNPAISNPPATDQRGAARIAGAAVDLGSVEGSCVPGTCLNRDRFAVDVRWQAGGANGQGRPISLNSDSAFYWFFDPANIELVVKVLDGCAINGRYWVFMGGLTNVRVEVTLTDVVTGTAKTYVSPEGPAFQPIQDTAAFATCP